MIPLPESPSPDAILDAFLDHAAGQGLELYEAQEEAIMEIVSDRHVILATPTGSGKSLVALAAHFTALAHGRRSFYTAPIKALVSEKFFELCEDLGTENVGMITGDGSVNAQAPIICCTAEILANLALTQQTQVDHAVLDEFHFYSDPSRGWAWQVPLLELPDTRFVLMSATLGDTSFLSEDLERRTGREVSLVSSDQRPVPLDFEYRETPLHESVQELLDSERAPVYVVHFTQQSATEQAQSFTSLKILSSEQKAAIKAELADFRFDAGFGTDLKKFLLAGIGVHHAGMLPRYRRLVERLAQKGVLRLISGTDTLGVGVNVPIRSVLFTQLCKYDGQRTRVLTVRDFQQIAGRAGRRGYDTQGTVWVQAPAHAIENKKAADNPKRKKVVKKKPPDRGYAPWNAEVMNKLVTGQPEPLRSSFTVTPSMLLQVLDRPGDGPAGLMHLLQSNHDPRPQQRGHIRRAVGIYRSLRAAGIVEELDTPDDLGRRVRVVLDLQEDFRLNQPLSTFVLDAIELLDPDRLPVEPLPVEPGPPELTAGSPSEPSGPAGQSEVGESTAWGDESAPGPAALGAPGESSEHSLDVLTLVESILDDPGVVLRSQLHKLKGEVVAELKSQGMEYEERMERLDELTWPQPNGEWLYATFNAWVDFHPWLAGTTIHPKSVARDLHEQGLNFAQYVKRYGLKRSEGVLLRYLSDAFKALVQSVPENAKTDELYDLTEWLGATVRSVDSSLLDEWERLNALESGDLTPEEAAEAEEETFDITSNPVGFAVMIRNEAFRWILTAARRDHAELAELPSPDDRGRWRTDEIDELMADYWITHDLIETGADARSAEFHQYDPETGRVIQTIVDPDHWHEWQFVGRVDIEASIEQNQAVVVLEAIEHLT